MCILLTLAHAWGCGSRRVCQSVSQSVNYPRWPLKTAEVRTTISVTTKQGIGMGSIAFSDVILLKSLLTKPEAQKVTEMVQFSPKNVETIPLTYMFGQGYQQVGNRAMSKYYMGDYMQALHWQVTVD